MVISERMALQYLIFPWPEKFCLYYSFILSSNELAWQQHDVQELCRVMFDALESKFKNTDQVNVCCTISKKGRQMLHDFCKKYVKTSIV